MAEYEGRYAEAHDDGDTIVIRCDRRTANYLALRVEGSPIPVLQRLRDRLAYLLVGDPAARARANHAPARTEGASR